MPDNVNKEHISHIREVPPLLALPPLPQMRMESKGIAAQDQTHDRQGLWRYQALPFFRQTLSMFLSVLQVIFRL